MRIDQVKLAVVKIEVKGDHVEVVLKATDDRKFESEETRLYLQLEAPGDVLLWDKYELRKNWDR